MLSKGSQKMGDRPRQRDQSIPGRLNGLSAHEPDGQADTGVESGKEAEYHSKNWYNSGLSAYELNDCCLRSVEEP